MYFSNRAQAGKKLATELQNYKSKNVIVLALSPGAVIVAAQIAMVVHSNLVMLLTENIYLPGETDAIATMSSAGTMTYNHMYTPGQLEEMLGDYHQFIEQRRMEVRHQINMLVGGEGEIKKSLLRRKTIILVSDGLPSGFSLDVAAEFLKTVAVTKIVVATPIASVSAVDKMHLVADEIHCLSILENYMFTDHYYDDNTIPEIKDLFKVTKNIAVNWQRKA